MRLTKLFVGCVAATCLAASSAYAERPPTPPVPKPATPVPSTNATGKAPTAPSTKSATTPTPPPLNPIAAKIVARPQLNAKVTALLPKGTSLNDASTGFKNQGQFIAALHVSHNLGIPFKSLQDDMTTKDLSLGQSIQNLKHSANATKETERAERQADDDQRETSGAKDTDRDSHLGSKSSGSLATRISNNASLNAKVQALLPTGMSLTQATAGFRSTEQFLAALHASKNLGIPFAQLQTEMTGKAPGATGPRGDHDSLSAAIQELKPGVNAAQQAQVAQTEARQDLQSSKPAVTGETR